MTSSNTTVVNINACTIETCSLEYANLRYIPSLAGNVIYAALLGLLVVAQTGLAIRYKTWGFFVGIFGGLALEIIGYAARIEIHYNPFPFDPFLQQLICLTIGPAFISASIYLCLGRIVSVYSPQVSRIKPRSYTYIFVSGDFVALVLQAAGGAIAATAGKKGGLQQTGVNIMIAGLVFQVVSLATFMVMCTDYMLRLHKSPSLLEPIFAELRSTFKFRAFLIALALATLLVFIRSVYRVAELQGGFGGSIANNEVTFMIFEGPMIILAVLGLTIFHPGLAFGGQWVHKKGLSQGKEEDNSSYVALQSIRRPTY
ncbi:putative RTA1 domain protein [Xylariales sp. PMI_506]|nr:putative RTA1 domain protein [Xylariales sp. PMI_506]